MNKTKYTNKMKELGVEDKSSLQDQSAKSLDKK